MEFDILADGEASEGEMEDEDELAEKDVGGKTLVDQLNDSTSTSVISEKVSTIDSAHQRAAKKKYAPSHRQFPCPKCGHSQDRVKAG